VWWKWTAPANGNVTFTTSGSAIDTLMGIYTGSSVNALTLIAYNDDENYPTIATSRATFAVTSGVTYHMAVDGYDGNSGLLALGWNFAADSTLKVYPSIDIVTLGSENGPFKPSSFNYTLSTSSGTLNWSVSGLPDWLTASITSGSTDTSGTTVTFSVNTAALSKAVGAHGPTTVTFTNTTNAQGNTTRIAGLTVSPQACEVMTKGPNFDGNPKGDILWRSDNGAIGLWFMDGTSVTSSVGLGTLSTDWRLIGTADFNGDGSSDLLWRNTMTGQISVWLISGVTVTASLNVGTVSLDWHILGAGDFNGDGKADLLWRQDGGMIGIWLMNDAMLYSSAGLGAVDNAWRIVGIADFNGDGKTDLLWHDASGTAAIWLVDGTTLKNSAGLGTVPIDWKIVGVGDFDGDGKADILWRQDGGLHAMWLMKGTLLSSSGTVGTIASDWHIAGINDYNGDSKADILWRHDSGTLSIWLMNGILATWRGGGISGVAYDWHIVNGEHDRPPVLIQPGPC
jgi:hypothetical protein